MSFPVRTSGDPPQLHRLMSTCMYNMTLYVDWKGTGCKYRCGIHKPYTDLVCAFRTGGYSVHSNTEDDAHQMRMIQIPLQLSILCHICHIIHWSRVSPERAPGVCQVYSTIINYLKVETDMNETLIINVIQDCH